MKEPANKKPSDSRHGIESASQPRRSASGVTAQPTALTELAERSPGAIAQRALNDNANRSKHANQLRKFGALAGAAKLTKQTKKANPLVHKPPTGNSTKVIQALTGFEAELHAPVYGVAYGGHKPELAKADTPLTAPEKEEIQNFLGGGLPYGEIYGFQRDGHYTMSADHDAYRNVHRELVNALKVGDYLNLDFTPRDMSNIEYRTPALEERTPGSTARMHAMIDSVKAHAVGTAAKAAADGGQVVEAPAQELKTGVPKSALDKMVSADAALKGTVAKAKNAINPKVHYQTTTGVLPSEIPDLFKASADALNANMPAAAAAPGNAANGAAGANVPAIAGANVPAAAGANVVANAAANVPVIAGANVPAVAGANVPAVAGANLPAVAGANAVANPAPVNAEAAAEALKIARQKGATLLLSKSREIAEAVMAGDKANFVRNKASFPALKGWVTLAVQYLLHFKLKQTNFLREKSTVKNLVGYLSKTDMHKTLAALPQEVRPNLADAANGIHWRNLTDQLVAEASAYNIQAAAGLTPKQPADAADAPDLGGWMGTILEGGIGAEVRTGRALELDANQDKPAPALALPGQEAIPLEDRYSGRKLKPEDKTPARIDTYLKAEWERAVKRRQKSTTDPNTDSSAQAEEKKVEYLRLRAELTAFLQTAHDHYDLGGPTYDGLKARLDQAVTNDPAAYDATNAALRTLRQDIYDAANESKQIQNIDNVMNPPPDED